MESADIHIQASVASFDEFSRVTLWNSSEELG